MDKSILTQNLEERKAAALAAMTARRPLSRCPLCSSETTVENQYIGGVGYCLIRFCSHDGSHYHIREN